MREASLYIVFHDGWIQLSEKVIISTNRRQYRVTVPIPEDAYDTLPVQDLKPVAMHEIALALEPEEADG